EALRGYPDDHFRWLLTQLIEDLSRLDSKLNEMDCQLRKQMKPYEDLVRRLCTIPGVKEITAWTLIAELGTDMSKFPTASHAASWAGLDEAIRRSGPPLVHNSGRERDHRLDSDCRTGDRYEQVSDSITRGELGGTR